jgi:uncharacterized protein (DUF58 family)
MLRRELMDAVRRIELRSVRAVDSRLSGSYHSVFKGRGIEFAEVRRYQPGDDVASIDWNVSARMSQPHIKLFGEDRDHTVLLLIDVSGSGLFGSGSRNKRSVAAELAAVLAFAASKNNDRVGLVLFSDRIEHVLPPKKGRRQVLRVIRDILAHEPVSLGTDIGSALRYVHKAAHRRSLVFVVSDFLDSGWELPLGVAHRRHDVVPVVVSDPLEETLPDLGIVTVEDLESGELLEFDTGGPEARAYGAMMAELRISRERAFRRFGLCAIDVRSDRPYQDALVEFFRARARRQKHT